MIRRISAGLAGLFMGLSAGANAQDAASASSPGWELLASPYALHWSYSPEHKNVYMLGIERDLPGAPSWTGADVTTWGFSAFTNSFGQPSAYAYFGYRWDNLFGYPDLFFKLNGGILYGYKPPYQDKVPFNHNGFSPALIPALGYRLTPNDTLQIGVLGSAGLIFMYSRRF
jgi:hypothetical protein